jgi:multiple sugar transport system ATP-binding protein
MAAVSLKNISKNFGPVPVLRDVSLEIEDGEFVVLVGPSGCGKSTLLRMIAGLEDISAGDIRIGERLVNDVAPKDRDIAMVFQSYALYPHMNVERNIGFPLAMRGETKPRIRAALLERRPRALSGGQRQRVAMGRAMVRQPKVFLFDEPLSNLDAKMRVQMRAEIKALHQDLKTTAIYVTHDQVEAMTLADRVVVMHGGIAQQVGRPLDIYDRPANAFVAGFIGSPAMNFLNGTVSGGRIQCGATSLRAPAGIAEGRKVTCGIRPEHIGAGDGEHRARIVVVESLGLGTLIHARLGDTAICIYAMDRIDAPVGSDLPITIDPANLHLFDPASGVRIG